MQDTCPTVAIKTAKGFVEINESDFDPDRHERYVAPPAPPAAAALPPPPPAPFDPLAGLARNWRERKPAELRALAEQVTGRTAENKEQAVQMIEAALVARVVSPPPSAV